VDFISRTAVDLMEAFLSLVQAAQDMDLKINKIWPTIWLLGTTQSHLPRSLLGVIISKRWKVLSIWGGGYSDSGVMVEIKARICAANKCYFGLIKHLSLKLFT
jgi:hypothetical protein